MQLVSKSAFCKADGAPYTPSDKEKKAMLLFRGGDDMLDLFDHVRNLNRDDIYIEAINKIRNPLQSHTNIIVQRNMFHRSHPQVSKSFEKWSKEIKSLLNSLVMKIIIGRKLLSMLFFYKHPVKNFVKESYKKMCHMMNSSL